MLKIFIRVVDPLLHTLLRNLVWKKNGPIKYHPYYRPYGLNAIRAFLCPCIDAGAFSYRG